MGLLNKIGRWFAGSAAGTSAAQTEAMLVVPAGESARMSPQARSQEAMVLLRRLGAFTSREQIPVTLLLPGSPLPKFGEGTRHFGVEVRYAPPNTGMQDAVTAWVKQAGSPSRAAVVAADAPVRQAAEALGAVGLHWPTLQKALDGIVGADRPPQERQRGRPRPATEPQPSPKEQGDEPPPQPKEDSAVLDLIDPL